MAAEYSDAKRRLLEKFLRGDLAVRPEQPVIARRTPGETIPLTHVQEQVWVHAQLVPHLPLYNEPVTVHYAGPLSPEALEQAFNEILRRHEAWRTSFHVLDGRPVQKVHENLSISLPVVDLSGLPRVQRETTALQMAAIDAREPFDMACVPLLRARLFRLAEEQYRLYLTLCHIIFDGVALSRVFLPELATLYKAFAAGASSPLPEPPLQYPDYASWYRRAFTTEKASRELAYWREHLTADLPDLYLPGDRRPPRSRSFRGSMYQFRLRTPFMKQVKEFCHREGVSLFHVTFAAFAGLLQRYSREDRIPIGIVTASRHHPEAENVLGYFLNTVVVPAEMSANPSFRTLVHRSRNWSIEAIDHDQISFEHLVREFKVQREPSRNPFFQAMFSYEPLPAMGTTWRLTEMDVDTGATKYDLYVKLDDCGDEVLVRFHYSTDLFDRGTIGRMALHWKSLLQRGISNPDVPLSDIPILAAREHVDLVAKGHGIQCNYPKACIHELFEEQAERTPGAVAAVSQGKSISYRDLNERANQVAQLLLRRGLQPEALVGLCVERNLNMVIALLGILKAGAAYVPLNSALPDERLGYLLADSRPAAIITDKPSWRPQFAPNAIILDESPVVLRNESASNPHSGVAPNNLAYVMYTSGSTGQPKGVAVEHSSVVNLLKSVQREPGICPSDVLLAVTTLTFDIAGLEIFLPLISGARVILAESRDVSDGTRLRQLLHDSNATLVQATPATWRLLIEAGWTGNPSLKILCGGESLSPELARDLFSRAASVWNAYGPTETTIWSSIYRLRGHEEDSIPIGRPIANTTIHLLDARGNPVPYNVIGEIYIGGQGLARAYLNLPELTAHGFILKSLASGQTVRLYRTGDLGRLRRDGEIEYLGRADTQIKLRGVRVELGEVESILSGHPAVQQVLVTVTGTSEQQKLSAYVLPKHGSEVPDAVELRRYARSKLPEQMIPAEYWKLDKVPLLPSGKIKRAALAMHGTIRLRDDESWVGPRNDIEAGLEKIWRELLNLQKIGVDQNFFELGGHSLLVLQMTARIRRNFKLELAARVVFEFPTISALAEQIEKAGTPSVPMLSSILQPARITDREAILDQLDRLSEDKRILLKSMLEEKGEDVRPPSPAE